MMWVVIFLLIIVASVGGVVYLVNAVHRFSFIGRIKNGFVSWLVASAIVAALSLPWLLVNVWAMAVVLIHLFLFWLVFNLIFRKKGDISGICALSLTSLYLAFGWYMAHHVVITDYEFFTDKNIGGENLRVVMFADSHLGITLDGEKFAREMEKIDGQKPDVVIIAGDLVDDDSDRADMVRACESLGKIDSTYGVYFSFGNHDKGYFQSSRDFTEDDLRTELAKNGVVILEDDSVTIDGNVRIVGRQDKSAEGRKMISEIMLANFDEYSIVIDHQPNDYEAETVALADLVLSGHTHGGHIFPTGFIGLLIGANDKVYGVEEREYLGHTTDFVVTSGISGWAIPFKTGAKSEIVVIDIKNVQ